MCTSLQERVASSIASLVPRLVAAFTGFCEEKDEENFGKSLGFVQRTFSNHQYLEPNGNNIESSYQALVEKLDAHSMPESADRLLELSGYLLQNENLHMGFADGKETIYSILSLLLNTSMSPTSAARVNRAILSSNHLTNTDLPTRSSTPYDVIPTMADVMSGSVLLKMQCIVLHVKVCALMIVLRCVDGSLSFKALVHAFLKRLCFGRLGDYVLCTIRYDSGSSWSDDMSGSENDESYDEMG